MNKLALVTIAFNNPKIISINSAGGPTILYRSVDKAGNIEIANKELISPKGDNK